MYELPNECKHYLNKQVRIYGLLTVWTKTTIRTDRTTLQDVRMNDGQFVCTDKRIVDSLTTRQISVWTKPLS
jgi:hypothetical protein